MKAGRIVGRVGGLAVALGVGAAVSLGAPAAWADDTGPASSDGATGSADGAEAQSRSAKAETTADPASPSTTAGSESNDAATPESGTASESPTSVPTGSSVRQAPPGIEITTGGAQSSTESNSEAAANDDPAVDLTTDEPAPESDSPLGEAEAATATAVVGDSNSSNRQKRVDDPMGDVKPLRPKASPSPTSVAGVALQQPAQPAATAVEAVAQLEPQANVVAQADAIAVEPAVPPSTLSTVVLAALGIAGWGSPAPDNPLTPVDSPLELALLALGARSRSIGQSTDDEQAVAMAAVVNSAPSVPAQPVGTPEPVTGVVTGMVIATDPDNDTLIYTVASGPAQGTLQLNSQTGAYTYTPTPAARMAAGTTPTADTDSFAVAVSDGQQTTTASVSVYISPIRVVSQAPIAVGTTPSAVVVSADGRMFVANTGSMTVSVINTVTGQRIDANSSYWSKDIAVEFSPSALALSADGKRLYVANTGSGTVSVIDATTYKRIDVNPSYWSKDIQVGSSPSALAFGSDGRLYVANRGSNTVSVINTVTNKIVDTNPNITGTQSIPAGTSPSALALSPDGRLYVANRGTNTVSVINTGNYSVTKTITVGSQPSSVALGADGRLYVVNTGSRSVSVISTDTDTVIDINPNVAGVNAISVGPAPTSVAFSPNGSFAYVANANDTVSVIDTATYTVVSTVKIDTDTTGAHVIAVSPNGTVYVTDAADTTVRVLGVSYGNTAPVAGTPTVGTPNTGSGAVSGALNVTDADGDILSYSLTQPSSGTVSITSAGAYTFTPTPAARQAAANGGPTSTTFTVNATDGQATTSVSVTAAIAVPFVATQVTVLGNITITGDTPRTLPVLSGDGTRAVIITPVTNRYTLAKTTRVAVINTTTGKQVGSTITLTGGGQTAVFSADGTRALIATTVPNTTTGIETTRVTVINTTTGAQTGTTVALTGSPTGIQLLGTDGSRALITTDAHNVYHWDGTVAHTTGVAVMNTRDGTQIGATLTLTGSQTNVQLLGADRVRVLVATSDNVGNTTRVALMNTVTGTQSGTTLSITGRSAGTLLLGSDNSRALITTSDVNSGTTRVTLINTTALTQIGTTVTLTGAKSGTLLLGAEDNRALIATSTDNTTGVTLINTTTGTQIGTTVTLTGAMLGSPVVVADSGRALITTQTYGDLYDTSTFTTRVAVINTGTGTQEGVTLTLIGAHRSPSFSADGRQVLFTNTVSNRGESEVKVTRVTLIDTTTGAQTGTTITLDGLASPQFSADGTRVLITTRYRQPITGTESSQVVAVNTATGTQIGTTLNLPPTSLRLLNADGTRTLITTSSYNISTVSTTMRWAVLDTTTGSQTAGATETFYGYLSSGSTVLSADGTRALITTSTYDHLNHFAISYVTVINTATGARIGTTATLNGYPVGYPSPLMSADGSRALITTNPGTATQLALINTTTGTQIGSTLTFAGYPGDKLLLGASGSLALIAIGDGNSTRVVVINTITGAQTGTFTVTGSPLGPLLLSADGSRALITTVIPVSLTTVSTRVTVLRIA